MKSANWAGLLSLALLCELVTIVSYFLLGTFMDHDSAQTISNGLGFGALAVLIYQFLNNKK